jgi:hypothetical protein
LLLLLLSLLLLTLSCSTSIWCSTPATCGDFRVGMSRHGWYNDPVLWPLDPLKESLSKGCYITPINWYRKRVWGPCVVWGPVDGRFLVWWVIDNVVWTDS